MTYLPYCTKVVGWRRWWRNSSRPVLRPHNGPHHIECWSSTAADREAARNLRSAS